MQIDVGRIPKGASAGRTWIRPYNRGRFSNLTSIMDKVVSLSANQLVSQSACQHFSDQEKT
jgi:hypothetical protein